MNPSAKFTTGSTKKLSGRVVRELTSEERQEDIRAFGREIRKTRASALAFLQSAGILDETGGLAMPFRE
jgi:hypothetical protein